MLSKLSLASKRLTAAKPMIQYTQRQVKFTLTNLMLTDSKEDTPGSIPWTSRCLERTVLLLLMNTYALPKSTLACLQFSIALVCSTYTISTGMPISLASASTLQSLLLLSHLSNTSSTLSLKTECSRTLKTSTRLESSLKAITTASEECMFI